MRAVRPSEHQEAVLFHELPCHAAVLADFGEGGCGDVQRRCAGPPVEDAVRVHLEGGVGADAQPVHGDPVKPVTGRRGGHVLPFGGGGGLARGGGRRGQLFDVGLALQAVAPPHCEEDKHDGDHRQHGKAGKDLIHQAAPAGVAAESGWGVLRPPSKTVGWPRKKVANTLPGSSLPLKGELRPMVAILKGSTVQRAAGSTRMRLAGSPASMGLPWSASRPIFAAALEVTRAKSAHVISPVSIMACWTTDRAVSSPVMPMAACAHSHSLCSLGCGAWSVPTTSIVPSARPARNAWTSASVRSGGLTLKTGS